MRALVLDGDTRAALAVVRSLGRRGVQVTVASEDDVSLAGCSRWCSERMVYPCPRAFARAFGDWLVSAVSSMPDVVLYTSSDVTASLVGRRRLYLPAAMQAALPPQWALETALDKAATIALARDLGVRVPRSLVFACKEPVDLDGAGLEYPVAVKACQSDLPYRSATRYAQDTGELKLALVEVLRESPSALVQEVVPGEGVGIFALLDHGKPLVTFAHRRVIEKPPWGGVSVVCESVEPRPDALHSALAILENLQWHGVAMVEFKLSRDGVPCLMEINPRFWGSLELAIRAGVDFPYLALQLAVGEKPQVGSVRPAMNRWLLGEIDSLMTSLLAAGKGRSRVHDIAAHVRTLRRGLCCEVERLSDPKPALCEHISWLRMSVSRLAARWRGGSATCDELAAPGA